MNDRYCEICGRSFHGWYCPNVHISRAELDANRELEEELLELNEDEFINCHDEHED